MTPIYLCETSEKATREVRNQLDFSCGTYTMEWPSNRRLSCDLMRQFIYLFYALFRDSNVKVRWCECDNVLRSRTVLPATTKTTARKKTQIEMCVFFAEQRHNFVADPVWRSTKWCLFSPALANSHPFLARAYAHTRQPNFNMQKQKLWLFLRMYSFKAC